MCQTLVYAASDRKGKGGMMKKIFEKILFCLIATAAVFAFAACGHEHTFEERWSQNDDTHWHASTCGHDISSDMGYHDYDDSGYCRVCGYKKPHTEHIIVHAEYSAPECEKDGNTEYWYCSVCGAYFYDEAGKNVIAWKDTVIEKTGHSYDRQYSHDETYHYHAAICGHDARKDEQKHNFVDGICAVCLYRPGYADVYADGVRYTLNDDGKSYSVTGNTIDELRTVAIASEIDGFPVVAIADRAFEKCYGLTGVTIPDGIEEIGKYAFSYCTSLGTVMYGANVKKIGSCAFLGCAAMRSVMYTGGIADWCKTEFVGSNPLADANENVTLYVRGEPIERLAIPDGVTEIGDYAFCGYNKLTDVILPDSVERVGNDAFWACALDSVTFGKGLKTVGNCAFYNSGTAPDVYAPDWSTWCGIEFGTECSDPLENAIRYASTGDITIGQTSLYIAGAIPSGEVVLPSGITEIPPFSFKSSAVTSVVVPSGVSKIGFAAFYSCKSLAEISLPDTLTNIDDYAFYMCRGLSGIPYASGLKSVGDYAFYNCIGSTAPQLAVQDGIVDIGKCAYMGNRARKLVVPASVESIGDGAFRDIFYLEEIEVSKENTRYTSAGNCLIDTSVSTVVKGCPTSIIPDDGSIKAIGDYAFADCDLTEFSIPHGVVSIGRYAFSDNTELGVLTVPDGVKYIGEDAFSGCRQTELYLPDSIEYIPFIGVSCKKYSDELAVERYEDGELYLGKHLIDAREKSGAYTVKDGTLTVGMYAFGSGLTELILPDSTVYFAPKNFNYRYTALTCVKFGTGITRIHEDTFSGCPALETVYLTKSVAKIDVRAFSSCFELKAVYYDGTIGDWNKIDKDENWAQFMHGFTIYCSDGQIEL